MEDQTLLQILEDGLDIISKNDGDTEKSKVEVKILLKSIQNPKVGKLSVGKEIGFCSK